MALYFLSYDLRKQKDYQTLWDELENYHAVRMLKSDWCLKQENTDTVKLRDHFKKYIDKDDGLIVSQVVSWASYNTDKTPND